MKTLEELERDHDAARVAVEQWMWDEGQKGELRFNSQAPGWPEYERALAALKAARASPEFMQAEFDRLRAERDAARAAAPQ